MTSLDTLDFYVVYFPRSAGKYFVYNYEYMTRSLGVHLHETEYLSKPNAISIVRNPEDSIASTVIAGLTLGTIDDIAGAIDHHVQSYIDTYIAILDSDCVIVRFDDVIDNFSEVANTVANRFGHTIVDGFVDRRPKTTSEYVSSSKDKTKYDEVYELVSQHWLMGSCYNLYNESLSKCILY